MGKMGADIIATALVALELEGTTTGGSQAIADIRIQEHKPRRARHSTSASNHD